VNKLVPDDVMFTLVTNRLKQPDCQIHGYVLEGFPKTASQVQLIDDLKIQPTVIAVLEKSEEGSRDKSANRRFDPVTGETYDLSAPNLNLPQEVLDRLQKRPQDDEAIVEKR
jgi:Adenylate kinase and related kinases